jgi:hypothetical protein
MSGSTEYNSSPRVLTYVYRLPSVHECGTDVLSEAWNLYTVLGILERMKHPLRANAKELEQHLLSPMSVRDHRRAERMAEQAKQARFKRRLLTWRDYAEMPQERSAR